MALIQKTFKQKLQTRFGNPKLKLKPISFQESQQKCKEINATPEEIKEAKQQQAKYVCEKCGYSSVFLYRCCACGGWLRYFQLYERILESRKLNKKFKEEYGNSD